MHVRRVVTAVGEDGKGFVSSDGPCPRTHDFETVPGSSVTLVWATDGTDAQSGVPEDPTMTLESMIPPVGGSLLVITQFPPDSVLASVDVAAAQEEDRRVRPGHPLNEEAASDPFGMHRHDTIDYVFVLKGEICLELESGSETVVRQGDIVVQHGTPHAWHNRTEEPALVAFVPMGTSSPS